MTAQLHINKAAFVRVLLVFSLIQLSHSWAVQNSISTLRIKRQNCDHTCKNGQCISEDNVCDGTVECSDGSDETAELCSKTNCPPFLFRCKYGSCINKNKICNGVRDCADNSDEIGPGCTTQNACGPSEFKCKNGQCISDLDICDGTPTCDDGSDETAEACSKVRCPRFTYTCEYGACVDRKARCNNKRECADGSDEAGCPGSVVPTPTSKPITTIVSTEGSQLTPTGGGCSLPPHPSNGRFTILAENTEYVPNQSAIPGQLITLTCNDGYMAGADVDLRSYCVEGFWLGSPVAGNLCKKKCVLLEDPTYDVTCQMNNTPIDCVNAIEGATIKSKCRDFYHSGPRYVGVCRNGLWKPYPAMCTPDCGLKRVNAEALIIGGSEAIKGEYPWITAIYNASNIQICGGSIITTRFVLSAAHCFPNREAKDYTIIAGKYYRSIDDPRDIKDRQNRKVQKLFIHEDYRGITRNYQHDIALIEVDVEFELSLTVQPVCVSWDVRFEPSPGTYGVVCGWGFTEGDSTPSQELKKLVIPLEAKEVCEKHLTSDFFNRYFTYDRLCAGYAHKASNVCSGDSGGGLYFNSTESVVKFYVSGIVSLVSTTANGCDANNFALYTKVSTYIQWISGITGISG